MSKCTQLIALLPSVGVKEFTEQWHKTAPSTLNLPEFPSNFLEKESPADAVDGDKFKVNLYTPHGVVAQAKVRTAATSTAVNPCIDCPGPLPTSSLQQQPIIICTQQQHGCSGFRVVKEAEPMQHQEQQSDSFSCTVATATVIPVEAPSSGRILQVQISQQGLYINHKPSSSKLVCQGLKAPGSFWCCLLHHYCACQLDWCQLCAMSRSIRLQH